MSGKNGAKKAAKGTMRKKSAETRNLSVFPADIAKLDKMELTHLTLRSDGMAADVILALRRHGVGAGEARKRVAEQVKTKFPKAHDATIRTQVYRGIVYIRSEAKAGGHSS
jgi:hypothetical protein